MIRIEPATPGSIQYVLEHLCALDRTELQATAWDDGRLSTDLARRIMGGHASVWVACDAQPITIFGMMPMSPNVGVAFGFSTKQAARAVIAVTRHIRRIIIPAAVRAGYHRIECRALARPYADRWMKLIDAEPEAILKCAGKNGEDFILYRWLRNEHALDARTYRAA